MFKILLRWANKLFGNSKQSAEYLLLDETSTGTTSHFFKEKDLLSKSTHLNIHDESLLDRVRMQWYFGDWQNLAGIDFDTLQDHPDRAKLALFSAAGLLQIGKDEEAKKLIKLALEWGVSKKLIIRIIAAGVHNSLARASSVAGDHSRAVQHFQNAIAIASPGSDDNVLVQARIFHQYQQLGLAQTRLGLLHNPHPAPSRSAEESH